MENINKEMEITKPVNTWFFVVTLLLSIAGMFDTAYLIIKRYSHSDIGCSIFEGCDLVTTSTYSAILGVPVAILGAIFYVLVFALSVLYLRRKSKVFIKLLLGLSSIGFVMSLWFVYAQAFILNAFCTYCLVSAVLSTTIFILSLIAMLKSKRYETNY